MTSLFDFIGDCISSNFFWAVSFFNIRTEMNEKVIFELLDHSIRHVRCNPKIVHSGFLLSASNKIISTSLPIPLNFIQTADRDGKR